MWSRPFLLLLTSLSLLTLPPAIHAGEPASQITWGRHHVPPYMIREGEWAGRGIFDLTLGMITSHLPQYQHVDLAAPFPRVISEIRKGSHWCYIGALRTSERDAYAYFSLPTSIFLPLRVIVRRDRLSQFAHPQSLKSLLQNRQMVTSVMRDRSYSPTVDRLLAEYPARENYSEQVEAISMLLAGRIDYMIELPLLAFYQARILGHADELAAIRTEEADEVVFNRVMCPKNEWGRQVIDQVNQVLLAQRPTPAYRALVERWHDPESTAEIRKLYDKVFLKTP